ncbi:MAG TPA: PaaI family thioesterase [Pyrinomonadaceae bacterium]|nr:PaaI family thioesterase [Chloracidobacterium sp.]MBP9934338.1 PaaI family thioesterase [Pyrinomonadaceae bacterium]MBK7801467.1 PaaI family thioesterase [Chloracidobacterium sp.]MBK9436785.1 PaaI family thioesterase [Chloracidobacterium sp.]MBK9766431.1 PaaI family thioesterase [Chloracidobacterium sp.]
MIDRKKLIEQSGNNELMQFLGVKIEVASADRVVLTMEVTPKVHQYVGIMNGGVSLYLCETAASIGVVAGADLEKVTPVGIEINANHLRAVSRGIITVEATPLHTGRTMSVWKIEITNDRGKLVCTSRLTMLIQKRAAYQPE